MDEAIYELASPILPMAILAHLSQEIWLNALLLHMAFYA